MALQGSIVVISDSSQARLLEALSTAGAFPLIETASADAREAIAAANPEAVILAGPAASDANLAAQLRELADAPVLPILALVMPGERVACATACAIPADSDPGIVVRRLSELLRIRGLHAAVIRRTKSARDAGHAIPDLPPSDALDDATAVVAGRGRSYPALAVAAGERIGLIGALSLETAAQCLKSRAVDGIVIGDGFAPQHVEALLTVLAEESRYRHLPIAVLQRTGSIRAPDLPCLIVAPDGEALLEQALPAIRMHALEARLTRAMAAIEAGGMIDVRTGLFTPDAFARDLHRAFVQAAERSVGISMARLTFSVDLPDRVTVDAARLVGELLRDTDFACREASGAILIAFADSDLRHAHVIVRRLAAKLRATMIGADPGRRALAPAVTLAARKPGDDAASLLARLSVPAIAAE